MKVDPPGIDATLRIGQEKLLKYIKPSEREILWIVGSMGNKGKSWFQVNDTPRMYLCASNMQMLYRERIVLKSILPDIV